MGVKHVTNPPTNNGRTDKVILEQDWQERHFCPYTLIIVELAHRVKSQKVIDEGSYES